MEVRITTEMLRRDHWFIARCPELDFVSQGASVEEAKRNLLEVIEIQFEEMAARGTLEDSALCSGLLTGTSQRPKVSALCSGLLTGTPQRPKVSALCSGLLTGTPQRPKVSALCSSLLTGTPQRPKVSALCSGLLTGTPQRPKVSRTWRRTTPELGRPAVGPGARWPRGHPRPAPSRATLEPAFSPE